MGLSKKQCLQLEKAKRLATVDDEIPDEGACVAKDATHIVYFNDYDGFEDRTESAPSKGGKGCLKEQFR